MGRRRQTHLRVRFKAWEGCYEKHESHEAVSESASQSVNQPISQSASQGSRPSSVSASRKECSHSVILASYSRDRPMHTHRKRGRTCRRSDQSEAAKSTARLPPHAPAPTAHRLARQSRDRSRTQKGGS